MPHTLLFNQGQDKCGKDGPSGSLVEDAVMVPSFDGAAGGLSKSSPTSTRFGSDAIKPGFLTEQGVPTLITCSISGNPSHHKDFFQKFQTSCLHPGDLKPIPTLAPALLNGQIGVSSGIRIPLKDLQLRTSDTVNLQKVINISHLMHTDW